MKTLCLFITSNTIEKIYGNDTKKYLNEYSKASINMLIFDIYKSLYYVLKALYYYGKFILHLKTDKKILEVD